LSRLAGVGLGSTSSILEQLLTGVWLRGSRRLTQTLLAQAYGLAQVIQRDLRISIQIARCSVLEGARSARASESVGAEQRDKLCSAAQPEVFNRVLHVAL